MQSPRNVPQKVCSEKVHQFTVKLLRWKPFLVVWFPTLGIKGILVSFCEFCDINQNSYLKKHNWTLPHYTTKNQTLANGA